MDAWMRRLEGLKARSSPRKSIPEFDGEGDAYWWLICIEKHFEATGTQKTEELMEAVKGLRNGALRWWQCWRRRHPQASWGKFTVALLWRYKPEYRDVLPIPDDEQEESEDQDQEQHPEKEHESVEPEKKKEDEVPEIKKNNQEQKKREKTKLGKSQVWSKLNVVRAMKMNGITTKQRRRRKKRVRNWNGEESRLKILELAVKRRGVAIKGVAHKLDKPSPLSRSRVAVQREEGLSTDNFVLANRRTGKTEENQPSPAKLPDSPDPPRGAACKKTSTTKRKGRRVADERIACGKEKTTTRAVPLFQTLGQFVTLMSLGHITVRWSQAQHNGSIQRGPTSAFQRNSNYKLQNGDNISGNFSNTSNMVGPSSFQQWDPGGESGLQIVQII